MTLWTPDGELEPEEREQAEAFMAQVAEAKDRIAGTPAADVIANHLMGLYELAAIHLQQEPPHFADAALAIDALRAVLNQLGSRLGDNEAVLQDGLSQLQMAFVELKDRAAG